MRSIAFLLVLVLTLSLCLGAAPATKPATQPDNDVLKKKIVELRLGRVTLGDVLQLLGDVSRTSITANWPELAKVQVDRSDAVTLEVKNKTLGQVLDMILLQLGPEKKLTYLVVKDSIEITTKAAAEKK